MPANPIPDVPKQQDKLLESSLILGDNNNSKSSLSQKAEPDGHLTNHVSSPVRGNFMAAQYAF